MKRNQARTYGILLVIAFCLAFSWMRKYKQVNDFYKEHTIKNEIFYPANNNVKFDDDFLTLSENAKGHEICVNKFEIIDYSDVEIDWQFAEERVSTPPDRLLLIDVTLRNIDGPTSNIDISNFFLFGNDSNPQIDYEVLCKLNPEIQSDSFYVSIPQGTEQNFILPYMLFKENYRLSTWRAMDHYPFYLQITAFPNTKFICLNN